MFVIYEVKEGLKFQRKRVDSFQDLERELKELRKNNPSKTFSWGKEE